MSGPCLIAGASTLAAISEQQLAPPAVRYRTPRRLELVKKVDLEWIGGSAQQGSVMEISCDGGEEMARMVALFGGVKTNDIKGYLIKSREQETAFPNNYMEGQLERVAAVRARFEDFKPK